MFLHLFLHQKKKSSTSFRNINHLFLTPIPISCECRPHEREASDRIAHIWWASPAHRKGSSGHSLHINHISCNALGRSSFRLRLYFSVLTFHNVYAILILLWAMICSLSIAMCKWGYRICTPRFVESHFLLWPCWTWQKRCLMSTTSRYESYWNSKFSSVYWRYYRFDSVPACTLIDNIHQQAFNCWALKWQSPHRVFVTTFWTQIYMAATINWHHPTLSGSTDEVRIGEVCLSALVSEDVRIAVNLMTRPYPEMTIWEQASRNISEKNIFTIWRACLTYHLGNSPK